MQWVTANSHWKLRNVTDFIITTEGPFDTVWPAYTIQKIPQGNGSYRIDIAAGCGNIFGCVPDIWQAMASFNRFVAFGGPTIAAE